MPSTPRGITYPDSAAHTRLWEHLQTLAQSVDAALANKPFIRVHRLAAQPIAANTEVPISWDTVIENVGFAVPALPNAVVTVPKAGLYRIDGKVGASPAAGSLYHVGLHLPTGALNLARFVTTGAANPVVAGGSVVQRLTAGQTLDLFLFATVATNTHSTSIYGPDLSVTWLRE